MEIKSLINNLLIGTVSVKDLTKSELNKCHVSVDKLWNAEKFKQREEKNFLIFDLLNSLYCESLARLHK